MNGRGRLQKVVAKLKLGNPPLGVHKDSAKELLISIQGIRTKLIPRTVPGGIANVFTKYFAIYAIRRAAGAAHA